MGDNVASFSSLNLSIVDLEYMKWKEEGSSPVYGWDYSDEELIWPNMNKLYQIGDRLFKN